MFYVYGYYEPDCLNPFYIGKGSGDRMWKHFNFQNLTRQTLFYCKLRSMILADTVPIVKILFNNLTEQEAFDYEIRLIALYGRRDIGTGCLCNMTDGGEGQSGAILSGFSPSIETRVKLSNSNRGKKLTIETINKVRQTRDERYNNPIESYNLVTGVTLKRYRTIRDAAKDGFSRAAIQRVLRGQIRHCKYIGWRYS